MQKSLLNVYEKSKLKTIAQNCTKVNVKFEKVNYNV